MGFLPDKPIFETDELSSSEKLILLTIKFHIGQNANSYVGIKCLARETGRSQQTVSACINQLEKKKWLIVQKREYSTSIYSLPSDKFAWKKKGGDTKSFGGSCINDLGGGTKTNRGKVYNTKNNNQEENQDKLLCAEKPAQKEHPQKSNEPVEEKLNSNMIYIDPTPKKQMNLEEVWKSALAESCPKEFIANFKSRDWKMAHDFKHSIGNHDAAEIINIVIKNWSDFCEFVKENRNLHHYPNQPELSYLLLNSEASVNFYLEKVRQEKVEQIASLEKQKHQEKLDQGKAKQAKEKAKEKAELQAHLDSLGEITIHNFEQFYHADRISPDEYKEWMLKYLELI